MGGGCKGWQLSIGGEGVAGVGLGAGTGAGKVVEEEVNEEKREGGEGVERN